MSLHTESQAGGVSVHVILTDGERGARQVPRTETLSHCLLKGVPRTRARPSETVCFCPCSAEIDQKLQEIMKQTGYLKIDGQVSRAAMKSSN